MTTSQNQTPDRAGGDRMELNGLLLIDKPSGITSFDVIRTLRQITGQRKFGHSGTLDPMAEGLMIILCGSATKQAANFSKLDKTYEAEITLGANSTTGDKEGTITSRPGLEGAKVLRPGLDEVGKALKSFTGEIEQTPSVYSAIKINGQEAYKRARRGESIEMPKRQVKVYRLEIKGYEYPILKIETKVSSGTYIRSLAQDIGAKLGTGAYLSALKRTEVGDYKLANAISLDSTAQRVAQTIKTIDK